MKQLILVAMILLAASVASAEDAPAMWMEQEGETINLMVNTSGVEYNANAWVHFDTAVVNITDVDVSSSPWVNMTGPGWSHQGDHVIIALVEMDGVAAGEYTLASMTVDCVGYGASQVTVDHAEPSNVVLHDLTYVCGDAPVDGAMISIADVDGDVTVPITISDASDVGAVDVTLTYDPDVVRVVSVSDGGMDCTYTNTEEKGVGWIRVGATQGSSQGMNGSFTLLNVTLEPIGTGKSCTLALSVATFKDDTPDGTAMSYTVSSGTYSTPPTPPPFINGDVNDDGVCDIADGAYLANHLIGVTGYETINVEEADVNGDGEICVHDAMYLTKHVMDETGFENLR
jgi:hypothetical protein